MCGVVKCYVIYVFEVFFDGFYMFKVNYCVVYLIVVKFVCSKWCNVLNGGVGENVLLEC